MIVEIPAHVQSIIDQAVARGQATDDADAVCQALRLYAEVLRRRSALKHEINKGITSGDSIPGEMVFRKLEQLLNHHGSDLAESGNECRGLHE